MQNSIEDLQEKQKKEAYEVQKLGSRVRDLEDETDWLQSDVVCGFRNVHDFLMDRVQNLDDRLPPYCEKNPNKGSGSENRDHNHGAVNSVDRTMKCTSSHSPSHYHSPSYSLDSTPRQWQGGNDLFSCWVCWPKFSP